MPDFPLKRSSPRRAASFARRQGRRVAAYLSRHLLAAAGVLMVGMLLLFAAVLYRERGDALAHARETSGNLATIVERDLARNLEFYSLSLQAMADGFAEPEVLRMPPSIRDQILFDRVTLARHISSAYLVDADGNVAIDLKGRVRPEAKVNVRDRDFIQAHATLSDTGIFISRPFTSRLTGDLSLAISRRVSGSNDEFLGVAVVVINIAYFRNLLDGLTLGNSAVTAIVRNDGTLMMRLPLDPGTLGSSVGGNADFQLMQNASSGSFIGASTVDHVRRLYVYKRVESFPISVVIAPAVGDILQGWMTRAVLLGAMMLAFASGFLLLSRRLANELDGRRRAELELKKLAGTDPLTGLLNRRALDTELNRAWARGTRTREPIGLLFLDVDHFKAYNDRYGHPQGDSVLVQVAQVLGDCLRRPGDKVARYGGEEFVVILPDTNLSGARQVATEIFAAVAALKVAHADGIGGRVTVSIGMAASDQRGMADPGALVDAADQALYAAKSNGRNRGEAYAPPEPD